MKTNIHLNKRASQQRGLEHLSVTLTLLAIDFLLHLKVPFPPRQIPLGQNDLSFTLLV